MSFTVALVIIVLILAILMVVLALISRVRYDGTIVIETEVETGKKIFGLEIDTDPYEIETKKSVSFKVVKK